MKQNLTAAQKLARILKILVTITFGCNILALFAVPWLAQQRLRFGTELAVTGQIWTHPYAVVLTLFLWVCGICTAVVLWQARRVLNTVLAGEPFCRKNAAAMRRAGTCCLVISVAALARLIWGFFYYRSVRPLLTYNALFVPVFAMGFLLCMVMSALFRQAAELKEENDLTI